MLWINVVLSTLQEQTWETFTLEKIPLDYS